MKIHRISLGHLNPWLIECDGRWIAVDAGRPSTVDRFLAAVKDAGCEVRNIALIVVTHAHYDHVGAVAALRALSGAPVAAHRNDAETMRTGGFILSDGLNALGRFKAFMGRHVVPRSVFAFEPFEPDILVDDEHRLDDLGFPATLVHTPGHSDGSISLLFDDGGLFAGDLAITQPLPGLWRHMPIYGTSIEAVKKTWRALAERGVKHIYPGHGRDFPAEELERYL